MTRNFSSALIAAALCTAGAAQAKEPNPSATIRYGDLNLASPSGVATFRGRVKAAANRLCGTAPAQVIHQARAAADCRAELMRSAEAQIAAAGATAEVTGTH